MANQISTLAAGAFVAGETFKRSGTQVIVDGDRVSLTLHGNVIARRGFNGADDFFESIELSFAGWNTHTTRQRLNGVLDVIGSTVYACQRDYGAYFGMKNFETGREALVASPVSGFGYGSYPRGFQDVRSLTNELYDELFHKAS